MIHRWWLEHDPAAAAGVPAHVTVLFAFVPRSQIDGAVRDRVRRIADRTSPFEYVLSHLRWFGSDLAYLAPEPDIVLRPPDGRHPGVVPRTSAVFGGPRRSHPHVTIGHAGIDDLRSAVEAIAPTLPITTSADRIELVELVGDRSRTADSFPLGSARDPGEDAPPLFRGRKG